MGPTELEQKRAQRQLTFTALCKRVLILHSSKLVVLAAFLAAVQQPGALGWLLVGESSASRHLASYCLLPENNGSADSKNFDIDAEADCIGAQRQFSSQKPPSGFVVLETEGVVITSRYPSSYRLRPRTKEGVYS